jgi:hypothetical protein
MQTGADQDQPKRVWILSDRLAPVCNLFFPVARVFWPNF